MNSDNSRKIIKNIDSELSKRNIELDHKGYFIIKVDLINKIIIAEHYLNKIDKEGLAIDPKTNEPIKCNNNNTRQINQRFSGRSAKEIGISITEKTNDLLSKNDHALYLGRELQKAEECIINNRKYVQD